MWTWKTISWKHLRWTVLRSHTLFPIFHSSSNPYLCDCSLHQTFLSVSHPSNTVDLEDLSCTLIPTQATQPPLSPVPQLQFWCWYTQHYFSLCRCYTFLACDCRIKSSLHLPTDQCSEKSRDKVKIFPVEYEQIVRLSSADGLRSSIFSCSFTTGKSYQFSIKYTHLFVLYSSRIIMFYSVIRTKLASIIIIKTKIKLVNFIQRSYV